MSFKGKVAVVTGAGGGLGRCYALELAKRGCNVIINDIGETRTSDSGVRTYKDTANLCVQEIESLGTGVKAASNRFSVLEGNEIIKHAISTFGSCDILVNNAGILRDKSFHKMSKDDWKSVIDVHLNGTFELSYAAWPHMQERNFGRIVNIGSAAGLYGNFGQSSYSAAKMGILGLSNTLAKEGAKYNINVNCVVPVAESKMTSTILPPHILSMLKPEHIAPFVAYLAHEDTRLTGGIFEVGAGWFSQVRFERSSGVSLGTPEQPASLETIRDQFERITDFTSSSHPTQISDSLRDMLANQSTAPSPSTNAAEAIINKVNQSPVAPEPVSAPSSTSTSLQSDKVLSALQLLLSSDSTKRVELVGKVAGSVQFHIGDSKYTKKWLVNLKTASDAVVREVTTQDGRSDVLVKCTDQVFMSLIQGKVSPEYAYFRGELEIKGNPQQIMKVKSLIEYAKLQKV